MTAADTTVLPPAAPKLTAAAVGALTSRLAKKLDATVAQYAALPVEPAEGGGVTVRCGEDALVTLTPGPDGVLRTDDQAACGCLLAPRCLHRAALLQLCPLADPAAEPVPGAGAGADAGAGAGADGGAGAGADVASTVAPVTADRPEHAGTPGAAATDGAASTEPEAPVLATPAQIAAADALWAAASAVLAAGLPSAGAVPQAELLRAAHTARLAGLLRAEAAALRVVRGLRSARARTGSRPLADLAAALRELLLTTALVRAGRGDAALIGTARRAYQAGGALRVHGVFREPVLTATGYGGVVTHLVDQDGAWYSVADVRPGGPGRARGAATAPVAIGAAAMDHRGLSHGGLLISGATVSADGRLGSGKGVRANAVPGLPWTAGPLASLFTRPLPDAAADRLGDGPLADPADDARQRTPIGCDVVLLGAAGDAVLARAVTPAPGGDPDGPGGAQTATTLGAEGSSGKLGALAAPGEGPAGIPETPDPTEPSSPSDPTGEPGSTVYHAYGPVLRLAAAHGHPELSHTENLRQLASHPGTLVRVLGRVDPDRVATLRVLAAAPVPGADPGLTLRLPAAWNGRADLGYDRLVGSHFPADAEPAGPVATGPDPLTDAPLWRLRRLVELGVAGGRRAVAESARTGGGAADAAALTRSGFPRAAALGTALAEAADRRGRDVFGRLTDDAGDAYAESWLAASLHLTLAERELVRSSWRTPEY
ncbi:hypothetical protein ACIRBX_00900 [Kitasatospora sp. NPDC096147]|uniref:hypothetical protein n=1 Tax=Kitasatospora sp. NPDC096147 TaxID=3364093 RepID=UPI003814E991